MRPARLLLIAGAVLLAAYGAGLLYETGFSGRGCCALTAPSPDPVQAERLMAAEDPQGRRPAVQRRAALAVLAARPADGGAWMRLAYADRLENGRLTARGLEALETSWLVLPYAGPQLPWRIAFALDNWSGLSPQARRDALAEIAMARPVGEVWTALRTAVRPVRDPSGRLSAALLGLL